MTITVQQAARELYDRFYLSEPIQFTLGWDIGSEKSIRVFIPIERRFHNIPAIFSGFKVSVEQAPKIKAFEVGSKLHPYNLS